jgi:hypothetical protein
MDHKKHPQEKQKHEIKQPHEHYKEGAFNKQAGTRHQHEADDQHMGVNQKNPDHLSPEEMESRHMYPENMKQQHMAPTHMGREPEKKHEYTKQHYEV